MKKMLRFMGFVLCGMGMMQLVYRHWAWFVVWGIGVLLMIVTGERFKRWLWNKTHSKWVYARGPGRYLVYNRKGLREGMGCNRFTVYKVFDDGCDLVVDDQHDNYNPYVGALMCYWLFRIGDLK